MTSDLADARDAARRDAEEAVRRAGVTVRPLRGPADCVAGAELLAGIWGTSVEASPLNGDVLTSLVHSGNCVLGAIGADGSMVGLAAGMGGGMGSDCLYSLIAGVVSGHAGRGVGLALKQAQRWWTVERGGTRMVWTYDPLVRRNAHFNLNRLGARVAEYLPDFYPPMHDALNRDDLTDRLAIEWDLLRPAPGDGGTVGDARVLLDSTADGEPVPLAGRPAGTELAVRIPADVEAMRRVDPDRAMRWRLAVREALHGAATDGYHPYRITADGCYVLDRDATI